MTSRAQSGQERSVDSHHVQRMIRQAFDTFDQQKNETVDVREVGTILRSIGIYPTLEQLHQWVARMETEEPTGYIPWDNFQRITSEIMTGKYPAKDDEETLFRAFQALDSEKKGYLTPDELKRFMTTEGEPFTKEEIDEMLAACTDPTENKIYYEDYVAVLAK